MILTVLTMTAALLYGGVTAYFYQKQDALIFPQRINRVSPELVVAKPAELRMPDGITLRGLEIIPAAPVETLVLLYGGNAHDVGGFVNFWGTDIIPAGDSTTAVGGIAYRGYRTFLTEASDGIPTEKQLHADARTVYEAYVARLHPKHVVLVGYSIGSAFAAKLAYDLQQAGTPVDGLIIITPFTSMTAIAQKNYPWLPVRTLMKYPLDTASFYKELKLPITLIYTPTDGLVPPEQPLELQKLNPRTEMVKIENTTHVDILNRPEVLPALRRAAKL